MISVFSRRALVIALSACLAGSAAAQSGVERLGRPPAPNGLAAPAAPVNLGRISATLRVNSASLGTGAVGLRNRGDGGIEVSGVTGAIKRALIYWAVITQGAPNSAVNRVDIKRGGTGATFTTVVGTVVGTGGTPCWDGDRITVYRGNIPLSIASGNGLYIIRLKPGANGSTAGGTPWATPRPPLPLFEGASIVLIGTGNATVTVYDSGLAGRMFFGTLSYQLNAPVSVTGALEVLIQNIGADGQIGVALRTDAGTSGEITTLNGRRIAGPASPAADSDWNGSVAGPLPQLWDNTTHDVTAAAQVGASSLVLPFVVNAPEDCLVPVANVLSIKHGT